MQATLTSPSNKPALSSLLKAGLVGGIIAAGINVIVLLLAGLFNIALNVLAGPPPNQQVMALSAPPVVLVSVVPALIGALLLFALTRITSKGATIFTIVAVFIALLSLLPVFGQPLAPAGMIVLVLMHLVAAGVITYWLTRRV